MWRGRWCLGAMVWEGRVVRLMPGLWLFLLVGGWLGRCEMPVMRRLLGWLFRQMHWDSAWVEGQSWLGHAAM